ncbi:MAG TPA: RagB/SusD family nutrient uptake outer membrane protein, partial [Flavisolibacter sp.]|nr:RagB/SusD family nutrient uptake outer membrane protein [Flavisolibacter sp.]
MKKIKILFIIVTGTIALSCKKQFLELNPISTVSVDVLYKTDKDFQDAVTGIYSALMAQYQNFWMFADLRSDDSKQEIPSNVTAFSLDNFTIGSDNSLLKDTWRNYYRVINRANTVLDKIKEADVSIVKNKARYIAEAKFLRALAYFDLVRIFGDVPMITTEVNIEE